MITFIIFIAVIGVLVLVHEFGHFITAKKAGMRVEEFGFGFPPRIFGFKHGETTYSINLIPFGGFVKIFGEEGEHRNELRSFSAKPISKRLKVVVAGVVMNFLLATILLVAGNFSGLRVAIADEEIATSARNQKIQIIQVTSGSPAQLAGIRSLDEIIGFKMADGSSKTVTRLKEVQDYIAQNAGREVVMVIARGSEKLEKKLLSRANPPAGEGPTGISLALTGEVSYPWYEAIWRGGYDAAILFFYNVICYWKLFESLLLRGRLLSDISGPIGIATMTGQAARIGLNYLMQFVAMISMNLAVLNIIPFPALDGGRARMLIIEKLRGKPLARKAEILINTFGFALLIILMIFVTVKDVAHFL